jgi:hypothetical protein
MSSIISRVKEILYNDEQSINESNEELEGDESPSATDTDDTDDNDLDADSICVNMDQEGYCTTGAECADVSVNDTCPYVAEFTFRDCCNFCPISSDSSSFGDNT